MAIVQNSGGCAKVWFLTGATGFLGRETLRRIIARPDDRVLVLIRPRRGRSAQQRLSDLLGALELSHEADRVIACAGDASADNFGLSMETRAAITDTCTHILHLAATTRFDLSLDRARMINVNGTRAMVDLALETAGKGGLKKVGHVSTAYVANPKRGVVAPDDLQAGGPFRNSYEQSKTEAEMLVRATLDRLPLTIYRPSIVVGDSGTGAFSGFSTIYPLLYAYLKGLNVTFGRDDAILDIVPVDYVASAMVALMVDCAADRPCYILAGGDRTAVTLGALRNTVVRIFGGKRRIWRLPPYLFGTVMWLWRLQGIEPELQQLARSARALLPYAVSNPRFDVSATEQALSATGIAVPPFETYAGQLAQYCLALGWGAELTPSAGRAKSVPVTETAV